jgi:hypothetical protein
MSEMLKFTKIFPTTHEEIFVHEALEKREKDWKTIVCEACILLSNEFQVMLVPPSLRTYIINVFFTFLSFMNTDIMCNKI